MRKLVIATIVLLIATAYITVVYFKNLNPPGSYTSEVIGTIPDNASVIFEFTNEKSFYDIFKGNTLLTSVVGKDKLDDIDALRGRLSENPLLNKYFDGQDLFISLHPLKNNQVGLLFTISAVKGFETSIIDRLAKQTGNGLIITTININGEQGYSIYISAIKKRFYVFSKGNNIFSGSFSEELAGQSARYKPQKDEKTFVLLSDQENSSSLANLYINYEQLTPLFEQLFLYKNTDIFKSFRSIPALAVLSLNYKDDAFMFNGTTTLSGPPGYLNLFADQQPVINQLKNIFPSTTAYSTSFSVSDPLRFITDLAKLDDKTNLKGERDSLFEKIKAETGVNLQSDFADLLGNEFAIVTTRYEEKFGIVEVKDGSKLKPILMNISNMASDNVGQFNYDRIPFFLLGNAFGILKRPYFMIADNYLILANSETELASYYDTYFNRKFLYKTNAYNDFDNLVSERSNVSFFINFRNADPVFKRDMAPGMYGAFENNEPGWKDFYAASYQITASDKNFYTNFCMRLNTVDTTATSINQNLNRAKTH